MGEVRRATRNLNPLSVVSIDIDHFKAFNDNFGHSAGDAVLAVEFQGRALGMITISLGVSTLPEHASSAEELMLLADAALYQAKAAGRDRTLVHSDVSSPT